MTELELPVVGYRMWRLFDFHQQLPWLQAWTRTHEWVPGENVAQCLVASRYGYKPRHTQRESAPHPYCTCGLHAHNTIERMSSGSPAERTVAYGAVLLYGRLLVGTESVIRAEKAEVLALLNTQSVQRSPRLMEAYGVPAIDDWQTLRAYALEHGHEAPATD